jgi:hypothetical protein
MNDEGPSKRHDEGHDTEAPGVVEQIRDGELPDHRTYSAGVDAWEPLATDPDDIDDH